MHEPYTGVASMVNETNTSNDDVQKDISEFNGGTTDDFCDTWLHCSDCFQRTLVDDMSTPLRASGTKLCRHYSFMLITKCMW